MALSVDIYDAASALYADYVASGSFTWDQVSTCTYHVLSCSSGCAIVIQPQTSPMQRGTYSTVDVTWGLRVEMYIRDSNNAEEVIQKKWDAHKSLLAPVVDGTTINDSDKGREAFPTSISVPPDTFVEFAGKAFIPIVAQVAVYEEG